MLREDDLLNENFEGYHITSKASISALKSTFLGEGVFETNFGQRIVIEFLSAVHIHTQQEQQDVLQKISSLQQVRHPHILPILAFGIYKDVPYIITEHLNAGTLEERLPNRITKKPMQQEEAIHTLGQIGSALHRAHQQQMIHGYVQPHNVLFDLQREALLTGFYQHMLLLEAEGEQASSQETSIYRAPEQLIGQTSGKSDQYALGCIAYEMFTGHKAFMVHSISKPGTSYRTKALIAPRRLNPILPLTIEAAILKAMAREPDQRFQDIAAFLMELGIPSLNEEDVTETVGIIEHIMEEQSANLPGTPPLELTKFETIKMPVPGQALNVSTGDTGTFKKLGQDIPHRPRRKLAIITTLVAIMIVLATMLITLTISMPAKRTKTVPPIQKTSTIHPTQRANIPVSTVIKRDTPAPPPTTRAPAQKSTPQLKPIPTPTSQKKPIPTSTPDSVPTIILTTTSSVQVPISLSAFFNDKGMGNTSGQANFDGAGYSYPASQLPSGGQIIAQGVTYQFPDNGPGIYDNIVTAGQTISLMQGKYKQAFLLASASWGTVSGTITITYTDGSTSMAQISVSDWVAGAPGVFNTTYRYNSVSIDNSATHIYAIPITLDNTRIARTLILPTTLSRQYQSGQLHVFAITLHP